MNEKQKQKLAEQCLNGCPIRRSLGKAPFRIECAGEFDIEGLHYYIFKFKKFAWRLAFGSVRRL